MDFRIFFFSRYHLVYAVPRITLCLAILVEISVSLLSLHNAIKSRLGLGERQLRNVSAQLHPGLLGIPGWRKWHRVRAVGMVLTLLQYSILPI